MGDTTRPTPRFAAMARTGTLLVNQLKGDLGDVIVREPATAHGPTREGAGNKRAMSTV